MGRAAEEGKELEGHRRHHKLRICILSAERSWTGVSHNRWNVSRWKSEQSSSSKDCLSQPLIISTFQYPREPGAGRQHRSGPAHAIQPSAGFPACRVAVKNIARVTSKRFAVTPDLQPRLPGQDRMQNAGGRSPYIVWQFDCTMVWDERPLAYCELVVTAASCRNKKNMNPDPPSRR